jgi:acyl-coenzyme A thioesterase PaaI-like protein
MTRQIENTWQIYPEDCNPIKTFDDTFMLHGGKALMMADRTAALLVKDLLKDQPKLVGLTVGVDKCQFYTGPSCGEVLKIKATVDSLGTSRITTKVEMRRTNGDLVFDGLISFCSFQAWTSKYKLVPHNLS